MKNHQKPNKNLIIPLSHKLTATITTTITTQPPSPPSSETKQKTDINPHEKSSETKEKSDQPTYRSTHAKNHQKPKKNQINPYILINPHEKSDSTSDQPTPINPHKENQRRSKRHRLHASMPPRLPRSTHNPNQPRPSKPTQTKTNPHHKLRLNHHRGLPTSLPSIINSNPHRYHRDHAMRQSRHTVTHSADLATL